MFINQYTPPDQMLLEDFRKILYACESEAHNARKNLSRKLVDYYRTTRVSDRYLNLPFLWFTVDYIGNANQILNTSDFHAEDFYEYLAVYLRKNPSIEGVFQLLQKNTPLEDTKWEVLQYECNKTPPLTTDELKILQLVYSLISNAKIEVLNSYKLRKFITNQIPSYNTYRNVNRFFTTYNALWNVQFNLSVFDLTQIYCRFQLQKKTSLKSIFNFKEEQKTLQASQIFHVRNNSKTFLGLFVIPKLFLSHFKQKIMNGPIQSKIRLYEFAEIKWLRICASLNLYQEEKGWQEISRSQWKRIIKQVQESNPKRNENEINNFLFITPRFKNHWQFRMSSDPIEAVKLFCKASRGFSFGNLPLENDPNFSNSELLLLRKLYRSNIGIIGFFPSRLISTFSLDRYWIELPKIPIYQLKRLLMMLPFSQIYTADNKLYLWIVLTQKLAKWIEEDLKWRVFSIQRAHPPHDYSSKWFDEETLQWKPPNF